MKSCQTIYQWKEIDFSTSLSKLFICIEYKRFNLIFIRWKYLTWPNENFTLKQIVIWEDLKSKDL